MTSIQANIDDHIVKDASNIIHKLGLSLNDAIQLYLEQITIQGEIPFPVNIPNAETIQAMRDADNGIGESMSIDDINNLWNNG